MNNHNLPGPPDSEDNASVPEVRLELTQAGVRQVLSLYAEETAGSTTNGGIQVGFDDIFSAIIARKWTVALYVLAGCLLGALILGATTPLYSVTTQVVLDRQDTIESALNSGGGGSAFIATQAEIMQSRSVIATAVDTLNIPDSDEDPVAEALETVQASPVSGTQVVALSYLGADPQYGADLLVAIVSAYRQRLQADEISNQLQRLEAKEAEYAALMAEVRELEAGLQALRQTHFNGGSAAESIAAQNQIISSQNTQLQEARQRRIELENQLLAGGTNPLTNDPVVRSLQDRLVLAEAELSRLTYTLKPGHPSREAAQREVTLLKKQLDDATRFVPRALERDIQALKGLEGALIAGIEADQAKLSETEALRREEQLMLDDLEQTRVLVEARRRALLDQRLFSRLAESGEVGVTARLIAEPVQPLSPTWPNPLLVLALFGMLGAVAGTIVAVTKERKKAVWLGADRPGYAGAQGS